MELTKSLFYFVRRVLRNRGWLFVWLWRREAKSFSLGIVGAMLLVFYGIVPTLQRANFGRVYAAYGGVFIVLSLAWGWQIDRIRPDRFDLIGSLIALVGVFVIMYWPRG